MNAYFDTGVLLKNYCSESNSREAISLILSEPTPLPLTQFQEAELRNTFRLKAFQKEITPATVAAALGLLDEDIQLGRFDKVRIKFDRTYRSSEALSKGHTATIGARLLDILHVAAALEIGSARFISFDQRQRALAKKVGLTVLPL